MPKRKKLRYCKNGHDIRKVGRNGKVCRECGRISHRKYVKNNKTKVIAQEGLHKRLKRYGLTPDCYNKLLIMQNYVCAICTQSSGKRSLSVDHNHNTGEIRGLLCTRCNLMLGLARDSQSILKAGIEYLK